MIHFREAGITDIPLIRKLAYAVWPQTYSDILSEEQTTYMLDMMYSAVSLKEQMEQKQHTFIIAYHNREPSGFASYSVKDASNKAAYRLHKIYVLPGMQGTGTGRKIIGFIIQDIIPLGAKSLELNVNRHNKAKGFYEALGFRVIKQEDIAIGNGYFMNDFVMEKIL